MLIVCGLALVLAKLLSEFNNAAAAI